MNKNSNDTSSNKGNFLNTAEINIDFLEEVLDKATSFDEISKDKEDASIVKPTSDDTDNNEIQQETKINFPHKVHFSFEARIISSIFCILILFFIACFLIFNIVENENIWNEKSLFFGGMASVLILVALYFAYAIARLVLKTTNTRNEYKKCLDEILTDYDRLIVIARNGYQSNSIKEVVKLDSFEELLDVRDILDRPIVYSMINNVKSEFIVEDDDKLYKFVLKEADLERKVNKK